MNGAYTAYTGNSTVPRVYSPVTLSNEWPKVERLVFMVIFACAGTTMNGFFVASFFVEEALRRVGMSLKHESKAKKLVITANNPKLTDNFIS